MITGAIHLVNGEPSNHIDLSDRGLLYGDGCFETIAVQGGRPLLWEPHLRRLQQGCERLGINAHSVIDLVQEEANQITADVERAVLKIIVTRGQGGRGYRPLPGLQPTRILSLFAAPDYPLDYRTTGIKLRLCDTRLSENRRLAGIKHLNRLEQVLARSEWQDQFQEGLMLGQSGNVIEGTISNIYLQFGDKVVTPLLDTCGVAGVMRETILDRLVTLGVTIREDQVELQKLDEAEALFVSNSLIGLWPVIAFANNTYPVTELEREIQKTIADVCLVNEK